MFSLNALENTISLFPTIEAGEQKMLSGKPRKGASATQDLGHFLKLLTHHAEPVINESINQLWVLKSIHINFWKNSHYFFFQTEYK